MTASNGIDGAPGRLTTANVENEMPTAKPAPRLPDRLAFASPSLNSARIIVIGFS